MTKLDLYRQHKSEYAAPRAPVLIDTKAAQYLAISGSGEPDGTEFQSKLGALYKTAFTIKMASKFAGRDYAVCKLEALWTKDKSWLLLIRTPDFITAADLRASEVRLRRLEENRAVQMLHLGPYSEISRTVERMSAFAAEHRLRLHGQLHEIYLSDPRRVAPERLRTIVRQPVR